MSLWHLLSVHHLVRIPACPDGVVSLGSAALVVKGLVGPGVLVVPVVHHHPRLDQSDQLVQDRKDLRFVHNVSQVGVLFLVVVEVLFVVHLFILLFPDFFNLVVVNVQLLAEETGLVQVLFGHGGRLWVCEAHKRILSFSFLREDLDALYLSILREDFIQLLLSGVSREVLDVQIASLLGVLVPHHVFLLFDFSFLFR